MYFGLFFVILFLVCLFVYFLSFLFGKKVKLNREKSSPFECGFDPNSDLRLPFSLRFFLITVIFLIFDVEIALLLPAAVVFMYSFSIYWFITVTVFVLVLLLGLFFEWKEGALEWAE